MCLGIHIPQMHRFWGLKTKTTDPAREAKEEELIAYLKAKAPEEYLDALIPHYREYAARHG